MFAFAVLANLIAFPLSLVVFILSLVVVLALSLVVILALSLVIFDYCN